MVLVAAAFARGGHRPTRVACLGDSNTFALPPMTPPAWCQFLGEQLGSAGWETRSFAYLGATVTGDATASAFATAADHIARAEAVWQPDVYILSYGTNDIEESRTPAEVVAAYERYRRTLIEKGRRVLVATTPQLAPPASPRPGIVELNALLRRSIPVTDLLDFDTVTDSSDYDPDGVRVEKRDGIHLNLEGQRKRAQAARTAIDAP